MDLSVIRWILLFLLYGPLHFTYTTATWPASNTSTIQLLGLFPDKPNASQTETTTVSVHSRAMFRAAVILSQQMNITIDGQLIGWQTAQTGGTIIGALSNTCHALSTSNVVGIVGPALSRETSVVCAVAQSNGIPTISYGATNPKLSDKEAYPVFYRTVPSDNVTALAIAKLFMKYNWTSCVIIYQNDDFGVGGADIFKGVLNKFNITVIGSILYDINRNKFRNDLKDTLLSSPTRIVVVWADTVYTSTILQYGLDNNILGPQFQWILTSIVPINRFNQSYRSKLVGMLTVEPAVANEVGASINTTLLDNAYSLWQQYELETFPGPTQVDNFALFAFDATWSLILSLQKLCSSSSNSSSSCLSFINSSSCYDRHLLDSGPIFDILSITDFLGVSGPVQFNNQTTDRITGTYYITQNVQANSNGLSYVPVLQWTESGDWKPVTGSNAIVWSGNSFTPPNGLPELNGLTLRIAIVESDPYVIIRNLSDTSNQPITKLTGYIPELLDHLQKSMGFTPNITVLARDGAYNDYVQHVADNTYDMLVADVTITANRRKIVDFSTSIFDNSLRLILRQSTSSTIDFLSFMRPFSLCLWLTILACLLFAASLICLVERRQNEALKQKSYISSMAMSAWFSFGTLVGYGADFHLTTAAGRLLAVGLYILSIILVATYTANLASDLTIAKTQNIISSISDIKDGKIPYNRIGIIVGSAIEEYYLREISGGSRSYYPLRTEADVYRYLLNNTIDAAIMDTSSAEYVTNMLYCNLTLVGSSFDSSAYGIVVQKGWMYTQILDVNLLSLKEAGVFDDLKRKWFDGKICDDQLSNTSGGVSVNAVAGLFITFIIICLLSLLLFGWLKRRMIKRYLFGIIRQKRRMSYVNGSLEASSYKTSSTSPSVIQLSPHSFVNEWL